MLPKDIKVHMTIQDVSWKKSGNDLKVTVKAKIFTGWVGKQVVRLVIMSMIKYLHTKLITFLRLTNI